MRFANDPNPDSDPLQDFPLGDGTADMDAIVTCPFCCESVTIALDPGSGVDQEYVEDCPVCCQPWQVRVRYRGNGTATVSLSTT